MKFAVVAHRRSATNEALVAAARAWGLDSELLDPRTALTSLEPGDVALARLDVLEGLDGIERGTGELERLAAGGVDVRNPPDTLVVAHDKLLTARALRLAGLPHPHTPLIALRFRQPFPSCRSCSSRGSAAGGARSSGARRRKSSTRRSSGCSGSRGSRSTARSPRSSSSLGAGTCA